ncbi:hypothetical protein D3C75_1112710 [compost metagenome]
MVACEVRKRKQNHEHNRHYCKEHNTQHRNGNDHLRETVIDQKMQRLPERMQRHSLIPQPGTTIGIPDILHINGQ